MLNIYIDFFKSDVFVSAGKYLLVFMPVALPAMLFYVFWVIRYRWVTMKFVEAQKTCLLEIRLPKEITKSPSAMEIFFTHLAKGGADAYGDAFLEGKTRPWFSLELVSTGGHVRFFVWCSQAKNKGMIETQLYAQYPNLEIFEADDYTKDYFYDPENYPFQAIQFCLTKPDPYPIKTYIEYGLDFDENQKEEYKIDPITSVLEYLGSLKNGENAWIQILIQKHEAETWEHGSITLKVDPKKANFLEKIWLHLFGRSKDLKKEIDDVIETIRKKSIPKSEDKSVMKFPNPTKGELEVIAALERSAKKVPFDCMIRAIYIAEKKSFASGNISGLGGSFKQYRSNNLNSFRSIYAGVEDWEEDLARVHPFFHNYMKNKIARIKKDLFYAYKLRSYFQWPYRHYGRIKPFFQLWGYSKPKNQPFVLTTEELATVWHFPSHIASQTPTLKRVGSKKSEAPSNLPI